MPSSSAYTECLLRAFSWLPGMARHSPFHSQTSPHSRSMQVFPQIIRRFARERNLFHTITSSQPTTASTCHQPKKFMCSSTTTGAMLMQALSSPWLQMPMFTMSRGTPPVSSRLTSRYSIGASTHIESSDGNIFPKSRTPNAMATSDSSSNSTNCCQSLRHWRM